MKKVSVVQWIHLFWNLRRKKCALKVTENDLLETKKALKNGTVNILFYGIIHVLIGNTNRHTRYML